MFSYDSAEGILSICFLIEARAILLMSRKKWCTCSQSLEWCVKTTWGTSSMLNDNPTKFLGEVFARVFVAKERVHFWSKFSHSVLRTSRATFRCHSSKVGNMDLWCWGCLLCLMLTSVVCVYRQKASTFLAKKGRIDSFSFVYHELPFHFSTVQTEPLQDDCLMDYHVSSLHFPQTILTLVFNHNHILIIAFVWVVNIENLVWSLWSQKSQ